MQIFPVFVDNGGILVLLFGVIIIGLMFRSEGVVKYPTKWILTSAIALFVTSAYYIVDWLMRPIVANGIVGVPMIKISLIFVGIGSILILATALVMNSKESVNNVQK